MQLHPCLNHAAAEVPYQSLIGARKMTKMNVSMLAAVSKWLIPFVNQNHVSVVITVNTITNIYYLYDTNK